jgi:hypothetical protein
MPRRNDATSAFSVSLVTASLLVSIAATLASAPSAGAANTVTGAPTHVTAFAGSGAASVNFEEPSANAGTPITHNTATATDLTNPANGGQQATDVGVPYGNYDSITIKHLVPGDSYTISVTATNSAGTGPASTPSNTVVPTGPPPPSGITCGHVSGSTSSVVAMASCRSAGMVAGKGTLPGDTFIGTATGTITWVHGRSSYSTTISITTRKESVRGGYCARKGAYMYSVTGTVTANTDPDVAVGESVSDVALCINPTGTVKQAAYRFMYV